MWFLGTTRSLSSRSIPLLLPPAPRRGLNNGSIAALTVVKQLWPQRNLSPRGWVILAAPAPGRRPPLRKRVRAWQSDLLCLTPPLPPSRNQRTVPFPLPLLGGVCTRGIECDSMVSVGPIRTTVCGSSAQLGLPAPDPSPYYFLRRPEGV